VTDHDSLRESVEGTVRELGAIDIVLANAGIGTYGTVEKGDPEAWLRTIDINLTGVYRTVHATLPHLLASRGYLQVVASIASFVPLAGMSAYTASKAGVEAFSRALRQEVGFRGVEVGLVHPSWIDTDLVREAEADLASFCEIRGRLPWPLRSTTSLEACAKAIVDGMERRRSRVFVPRSAAVLYWLRSLVTSAAGERRIGSLAAEVVPQMEAEIEALGRASSARTTEINELRERS
jgi:NAD(P)-dependent dehydrogenase (short-subunit alcohol dehydrogenase family)